MVAKKKDANINSVELGKSSGDHDLGFVVEKPMKKKAPLKKKKVQPAPLEQTPLVENETTPAVLIEEHQEDNMVSEPLEGMYYLKQSLAYLEIKIEDSFFQLTEIPVVYKPESLVDASEQLEFVYPIYDYGDRLLASKGSEDLFAGQSMIKMFYTIEKMISILYQKIKDKEEESGETRSEIKIYLDGFELCLRKAFEVIINLPENWIVMNYDPGEWGNRYLEILQKLFDKGYAYPPPAPRDYYRYRLGEISPKPKISK